MTAVFNPGVGTLAVFGDSADNEIVISRDELGVISVNGEVPLAGGIPGGFPTAFNTRSVSVFGLSGNDTIRLDETNGPLPGAQMFGGSGTAVQELRIDLEAVKNGGAADDKIDRVVLNGTNKGDIVSVLGQPGNLFVLGLPTFATIQRAAAADQLNINTLGGNDRVEAGSIAAVGRAYLLEFHRRAVARAAARVPACEQVVKARPATAGERAWL